MNHHNIRCNISTFLYFPQRYPTPRPFRFMREYFLYSLRLQSILISLVWYWIVFTCTWHCW